MLNAQYAFSTRQLSCIHRIPEWANPPFAHSLYLILAHSERIVYYERAVRRRGDRCAFSLPSTKESRRVCLRIKMRWHDSNRRYYRVRSGSKHVVMYSYWSLCFVEDSSRPFLLFASSRGIWILIHYFMRTPVSCLFLSYTSIHVFSYLYFPETK